MVKDITLELIWPDADGIFKLISEEVNIIYGKKTLSLNISPFWQWKEMAYTSVSTVKSFRHATRDISTGTDNEDSLLKKIRSLTLILTQFTLELNAVVYGLKLAI